MKPHSSISNSDHTMKKRLSYPKRFLIFGLLVSIVFFCACATVYALEKKTDDLTGTQKITMYQMQDFYSLPEQSVDVMILGSSHAMCTYDPAAIQEHTGLRAFNLGTALQQPDTGYYLLEEIYRFQTPKYLILDVYFKVMQNERSTEQAQTVLLEMKPALPRLALWWSALDLDSQLDYFNNHVNPFGRIHSILSNWGPARSALDEPRNQNYRGLGFYLTSGVVSDDDLTAEKHPFPISYAPYTDRQIEYLKRTVALAREHGTQVLLVTAPIPPTILGRIDYYPQLHQDTQRLAEELGLSYHDYCMDQLNGALSLTDQDFADQGHLNQAGVSHFTPYFFKDLDVFLKEGGAGHE